MTATLSRRTDATRATRVSILNFNVIKARVADIKKIDKEDVTDVVMADFFGRCRETITRWRGGSIVPSLPAAIEVAQKLGVTVDEITVDLRASK